MAKYKVKLDGREYAVSVVDSGRGARVTVEGTTFDVEVATGPDLPPPVAASTTVAPPLPARATATRARVVLSKGSITAPIPGMVTELCVSVGDAITANQVVLRLEAMKMENAIRSSTAGTVKEIAVAKGAEVRYGQLLMVIE